MVKPTTCEQSSSASPAEYVVINRANSSSSSKYKGVRKRKWGRWVSEIRLPNSRERIWLGSYDSAEKAARAFDAALFCLRGRSAKFNFPENPPNIAGGQSLSTSEIQAAAARFAREVETDGDDNNNLGTEQYKSSSSVSDGTAATTQAEEIGHHHDEEMMDWSFLSMLDNSTNYQGMSDYSFYFSGGDKLYPPPPVDDGNDGDAFSQSSFLWNF